MTEKQRIIINIIATYTRSVVILFVTLFSSRWLLSSLGKIDYGLYGLVGGLTLFIAFINTLMSTAVSRFYAFAEGERQAGIEGSDIRIQEWFNTALLIHSTLSTALLILGYPLGVYAIRNWLTIPADRITQCVWVFRLTCFSCYIGMVSVPFSAMFIAKQRIAEYTVYNLIIPIVELFFVYYMTLHGDQWLVRYALVVSLTTAVTYIIVSLRAIQIFPECRAKKTMLFNEYRIKSIINFAGWQCFGNFGSLVRSQGMAILGNLYYGPEINSSLTISNRVYSQTDSLAASLRTAFAPAITNAYGAKEYDKVKDYAVKTNKIGAILAMIMGIPISLEIDKILEIWLKEPPAYTSNFCLFIIISLLIDKTTGGYMLAVSASGRIALYQGILGTFLILSLPLAYLMIKCGGGVLSIGYANLITIALCAWGRVFFARRFNISVISWVKEVLIPVTLVYILSSLIGYLPHVFLGESIKRIILTLLISETALIWLSWFIILKKEERGYIKKKATFFLRKVYG